MCFAMTSLWPALPSKPSRADRLLRPLRERPSAFLLGAQCIAMVALAFVGPAQRPIFSLVGLVILLLAIITVRATPALTWISGFIALPALILELWSIRDPGHVAVFVAAHSLLAIFYFYVGYALIAYVFDDHWVTRDELFAVGAAFTVITWAFAYVFLVVQELQPGSFAAYSGPEGSRTFHDLLYLSVANFTSVGLSDILPIRPVARAVGMIEQLCGVLYVAMVISRLVSLSVLRRV